MKRITLLSLFLGLTNIAIAQFSIIPNIKIAHNNSQILDKDELHEVYLESAKLANPSQLNYNLGVDFTYQLSDKSALRGGLAFQELVHFGSKIDVVPTEVFEFNAYKRIKRSQYLVLPIGIQYSFKKTEKWNTFIDFGGSLNYFTRNPQRITIYDDNDKKIETKQNVFTETYHRKVNYNLTTGIGINYNISEKLFWRFTAFGDIFMLSSFNFEDFDGVAFPARYYNYGISAGLGYNL